MSSNNWVIDNLSNALDTWNSRFSEIWQLITQSPEEFKGGGIWQVMVEINGALNRFWKPWQSTTAVIWPVKLKRARGKMH